MFFFVEFRINSYCRGSQRVKGWTWCITTFFRTSSELSPPYCKFTCPSL